MIIQEKRCSICLCDLSNYEKVRKVKCGHIYHAECLEIWLKEEKICPMCKEFVIDIK